jgi:hypothetical protein
MYFVLQPQNRDIADANRLFVTFDQPTVIIPLGMGLSQL